MTEDMSTGSSVYVYGVLDQDSAIAGDLGNGVAGSAVRMLPLGTLAALVSDIPPGPVAQTRRNMIAHTAVLERAMVHATILPVRFGTVAPGVAALADCLAANAADLRRAMAEIDGRVELGVKASWRPDVVLAEIVASDADLARMRDRLRNRPASETYYERVELGRRIEAALTTRRVTEAAEIVAGLTPIAEREVELRTLEQDMILNRAFLVRRDKEAQFDARMQAIAERWADRVEFRYIGPVPPYNFVRVQAGVLTGEAARWDR
jgi:hypothetical protein